MYSRSGRMSSRNPSYTPTSAAAVRLVPVASWPDLRVLSWDGDTLYASRRYTVLRWRPRGTWTTVAAFRPPSWRRVTSSLPLSGRLVRDGFHALRALPNGDLIGVVAGGVVTRRAGEAEFSVSHVVRRGTRPLNLAVTGSGTVLWGEYFDNPGRDEVHVFASDDGGRTWSVAHTFPRGTIRHVHNVVYDRWDDTVWILTGDYGAECRVLRATSDLRYIDVVRAGDQQARAVAAIVTADALYLASDTAVEQNHVYRFGRDGAFARLGPLTHSSFHGCAVGVALFFSTVVEPSDMNPTTTVALHGSGDGRAWPILHEWRKDRWPMRWFQYGCAVLPSGENATDLLAATGVAVNPGHLVTNIWRVTSAAASVYVRSVKDRSGAAH
jgi:hypothetical protein